MNGRCVSRVVTPIALAAMLAGCATSPQQSTPQEIRSGMVEQVTEVQIQFDHTNGVGAIVGGVVGLGIGSLVGAGTGRDVAEAAGALGGAVAGNAIQKHYAKPLAGEQIIVRLRNGVLVSITQPGAAGLSKGERVYVEGSGQQARVIAQQ